ncbi:conjugal transfer protein TraG N-terminal domain-containing protein [Burkholderia gladioli]|uniref:Sex pilus assembly protein TraG n=1 Tax=Burkholderia gladioli (strain BSR3) TaxID=999541 RepID=F2LSH7_BURGS|nr:conjugal transfer protein TraG N-terminal domain-containing protein [Burkholderia gladioli]AEA65773.1 sex pilus assembly protein TraG [Burkholderia gladioli BSR3]
MMQHAETRLATWRARARRVFIPATVGLFGMPLPALAGISNMQSYSNSYSFPTLYTAGDPVPIASALNSVAMLFGGGDSVDSIVAGGMACMALVALIAVIGQSVLHNRFMIGEYLVMLLAAICLFIPTTSIQVVSYFSDSGTAINSQPPQFVDNVPIGMAYAAGIAGLVDYTLTNKIETAFSSATADSNFMALGTDGFAKPLKLMLDMRDMFDCNTHQTTCQNIQHFVHYCKYGGQNHSSTLDMTQLDNPATGAGIVGLLSSQTAGYTEYASQTVGTSITQAQIVPCTTAAQGLIATMNSYIGNAPVPELFSPNGVTLTQDLQVVTAQNDSSAETPNSTFNTSGSAFDDYSAFIQGIASTNQIASNTFMINHIFSKPVLAAIQADAHPDAAATFTQIMGDAKERARVQMAGSGSMFTEFMTSTMNIMTFLFVALTPIVAILFLAAGMRAFSIVFTYLMFGIWTQSWMPCAAIISYYTQISYQNMIGGSRVQGMMFAPSNIDRLYDRTADMLASAGSMMAEAPLIMMAVMSGSMFALTSLANKANASGAQINPDVAAPNVSKATNSDAIISSYAANTGHAVAGAGIMGAVTSGGALTEAQVQASPQLTTSTGFQNSVGASASAQVAQTQTESALNQIAASAAAQFGRSAAHSMMAQVVKTTGLDQSLQTAMSNAIDHTTDSSARTSDSSGTATTEGVKASAQVGGSIPLIGGASVGASYGVDNKQSTDTTRASGTADANRSSESAQNSTTARTGTATSIGETGTSGTQASENHMVQEMTQRALSAQQALTNSRSLQHSMQESANGAAQSSIRMGALTQNIQSRDQGTQSEALAAVQAGARSTLQQATSDSGRSSQIMSQLMSGVDNNGGYSPTNITQLMRNATGLLRSNDFASQAVGYRVASEISRITGMGDSQGMARTASAFAGGARTMEQQAGSMTPGLSNTEAGQVANLGSRIPAQLSTSAARLGVSDPSNPASFTPDVTTTRYGQAVGQVNGEFGQANGVHSAAQAQGANNVAQGAAANRTAQGDILTGRQNMLSPSSTPTNDDRLAPAAPVLPNTQAARAPENMSSTRPGATTSGVPVGSTGQGSGQGGTSLPENPSSTRPGATQMPSGRPPESSSATQLQTASPAVGLQNSPSSTPGQQNGRLPENPANTRPGATQSPNGQVPGNGGAESTRSAAQLQSVNPALGTNNRPQLTTGQDTGQQSTSGQPARVLPENPSSSRPGATQIPSGQQPEHTRSEQVRGNAQGVGQRAGAESQTGTGSPAHQPQFQNGGNPNSSSGTGPRMESASTVSNPTVTNNNAQSARPAAFGNTGSTVSPARGGATTSGVPVGSTGQGSGQGGTSLPENPSSTRPGATRG